eukprot:gene17240-20545_t
MLVTGYWHSPLQLTDIWDTPKAMRVDNSIKYMDNVDYSTRWPLVLHTYRKYVWRHPILWVIKITSAVFSIMTPLLLKTFLYYIQLEKKEMYIGWLLCIALFFSSMTLTFTNQYGFWFGMKMCLEIRGALISTIFQKMLRLNNNARKHNSAGVVMNLISVDVDAFEEYFWNNCIDIFIFPVLITTLLIMLCFIVGPAAGMVGFLVMVIGLPFNAFLSKRVSDFYLRSLGHSDKRVGLIGEILAGIRFLKLYSWEQPFVDRVQEHRRQQVTEIKSRNVFWASSQLVTQVMSGVVLLCTFSVYVARGGVLDASIAFTSLTIFVNLRRPLEMLPEALQRLMKIMASSRRMEAFLQTSEVQSHPITFIDAATQDIRINTGHFDWNDGNDLADEVEEDEESNGTAVEMIAVESDDQTTHFAAPQSLGVHQADMAVLRDIEFTAPAGKLTMICGTVGGGKTSLVSAIVGEIYKVRGQVYAPRTVGFTTQMPFLISASLRENIVFGAKFNRDRYIRVIEACALQADLAQLPARDHTEIGERGLNLSGGQKQRISLARALYADPECYVMDEPLSAVDSEVASHLFEKCVRGMMANRTRILVTHQLQFVPSADHIVVVNSDGTIIQGTYQQLSAQGIDFETIMKSKAPESTPAPVSPDLNIEKPVEVLESIESLIADDDDIKAKAHLLVAEDRNKGSVGLDTYGPYIRAGGSVYFGFIVAFYLISQIAFQSSDYWLAIWTRHQLSPETTDGFYLRVYACLIGGYIVLLGIRYFSLSRFTVVAAVSLHDRLLNNIVYAPCLFFDQNPSGRILNRFSKDMSDVDTALLEVISDLIYCGTSVLISVSLMIFVNPIMAVPLVFLASIYFFVQQIYRYTSRELKRMESISRSPIFSLIAEAYNGMTTIRSFKQQKRFVDEIHAKIDVNQRLYYYSYAAHRWLGTRLELIASTAVLFSSLFSVYNASDNPGMAGLAVTTALGMTGFMNRAVRQYTALEVKMNSVERLNKYVETPSEGLRHSPPSEAPPAGWPIEGRIEFSGVEVRYREGMDPSLRDITAVVLPREKIGVVGRTGAGKSTMGAALFRMVNASKGKILIDGIDISTIGLHDLRSRLAVIPQDPFIFSGSVKLNLDAFGKHSDAEIWECLEKVQMKAVVSAMPEGLDTLMQEGGDGLSVGQKQLLCLCRALLRNSKIVLMDEATASLDYHTDSIIKDTIATNFSQSTVLTIAHRLDTIYGSSRIMVVDKGTLSEYDTPSNLTDNPDSRYTQLLRAQSTYLFPTTNN